MTTCDGLGAPQVLSRIPGLTYRQLTSWSRSGRLSPHEHRVHDRVGRGSGVPYCWPLEQVKLAGRMHQLIQLGFNLDTADSLAHNRERLSTVAQQLVALAGERRAG